MAASITGGWGAQQLLDPVGCTLTPSMGVAQTAYCE
jgi:hypothetical protein